MLEGREVTTHRGNTLNDGLRVIAFGEPGNGGAHWRYYIERDGQVDLFQFQQGNPADGINGISGEALLAIVRDRLEGFQAGPFACIANGEALEAVKLAMYVLQNRTAERASRGVEGTQKP